MLKRTFAAVMTLVAMFCFTVAGEAAASNNWLIYIYMCGTNLEDETIGAMNPQTGEYVYRKGACASRDIYAMQKATLPPNVKVLINANGATKWAHTFIQREGPGIYLLQGAGKLAKMSNWKADMGNPDTLKEFLEFGEKNFSEEIDHRILIFFDHGGLNGLCYDKAFDGSTKENNLTYYDLKKVLSQVYKNPSQKPFELIGFNICLSSSYELANSISGFSKYMVGSEPSEFGWNFGSWLQALANNPNMSGAQIGQVICDSTMDAYNKDQNNPIKVDMGNVGGVNRVHHFRGLAPIQTFSVINLAKMPELTAAYDRYFNAAKKCKAAFARAAELRTTERYSELQMDLGTLAENTKDILPKESQDLLNAIHNAVVYYNKGEFLSAQGISTYYPFLSNFENPGEHESNFKNFLTQKSTPGSQKGLYKSLMKLDATKLQLLPVELDDNDNAFVKLTPAQMNNIAKVQCMVLPYVEDGDISFGMQGEGLVLTYSAEDIKADWNTGVISENFRAVYPTLGSNRIYMEPSNASEMYKFYRVPVIIQGTKHYLTIVHNLTVDQYIVAPNIDAEIDNGMVMPGKLLEEGTEITPLFLTVIKGNSPDAQSGEVVKINNPNTGEQIAFKLSEGETFQYYHGIPVNFEKVPDGNYVYFFQFIAPNGSASVSLPLGLTIDGNSITKEVLSKEDVKTLKDSSKSWQDAEAA